MKSILAALLVVVAAIASPSPSANVSNIVEEGPIALSLARLEGQVSLNLTRLSCWNDPFVAYKNGSNSTHECFLSQFNAAPKNTRDYNELRYCLGLYPDKCVYIGNDRRTSPTLPFNYLLGADLNGHALKTVEFGPVYPLWRIVELEGPNWGFMLFKNQYCLDAYWENHRLKVHSYPCSYWNSNQFWNFQIHNRLQIIEHAVHKGWCLQTNGMGYNVEMTRCNWGVQEQQRRFY